VVYPFRKITIIISFYLKVFFFTWLQIADIGNGQNILNQNHDGWRPLSEGIARIILKYDESRSNICVE